MKPIKTISGRALCVVILWCAATAMGQSVASNASAVVESATVSSLSNSAVSASVDSMTNAGAGPVPRGGASSRLASTTASIPTHVGATLKSHTNFFAGVGVPPKSVSANRRNKASAPGNASTGSKTGRIAAGGGSGGYSQGFPDSTRGTGFPNPPDPGTDSPIAWKPTLNFAFGDMAQRQFLDPTFRVSAHITGAGGRKLAMLQSARQSIVTSPLTTSLPTENIEQQVLGLSTLKTSVNNPLGQ